MNIIFLGTPQFSVGPLKAVLGSKHRVLAVVSQPDREKDKKGNFVSTPLKAFAQSQGLKVLQYHKVSSEGLGAIRALKPQLMVTAAFGQILSEEFLSVAPVYNIHASLLPLYRGSAPIQSAIINGDHETGITIMKTVQAMDAGDILLQEKIAIGENEPFYSLHDRLAELGAKMIVKALDAAENGTISSVPQNGENATYTKKVTKADGLIDWAEPAEIVARKIRAYNPWPAGYTFYHGDNIKIYNIETLKSDIMHDITPVYSHKPPLPGTVLSADEKTGLLVQCGKGILKILSLQAPGKRALGASEFLRGYKISEGSCFSGKEQS